MLREVLNLGDKIEIKPLDKTGKPLHNTRSFVSQLVDFVESDVVSIAAPLVFGRAIPLNPGGYFNLCFYTTTGLYQCNCLALTNRRDNNLVVSEVRIVTNLEKYQRRQYFRLECILDINYRVITTDEEILAHKLHSGDFINNQEREECKVKLLEFDCNWIPATVIDISGGGARFNSPIQHNQGDKIRLNLDLPMGNTVSKLVVDGSIIASNRVPNRIDSYENRVQFVNIATRVREVLIKYIFEQDRKRRKSL